MMTVSAVSVRLAVGGEDFRSFFCAFLLETPGNENNHCLGKCHPATSRSLVYVLFPPQNRDILLLPYLNPAISAPYDR